MHTKRKIKAGIISILTGLFLFIIKVIAFFFSSSLAILGSAFDSLMDTLVSSINLIAIKESSRPPDKEHSFGHGKIEAVAGFFQSILIFAVGVVLLVASVQHFINHKEVLETTSAIIVSIISVCATFVLSSFLKKEAKATKSLILSVDRLHFSIDFYRDLLVIVSLIAVRYFGLDILDHIAGFVIAFYIMFSSYKVFLISFSILTDHELSGEIKAKITEELNKPYKNFKGWHNLRTRMSGNQCFIDVHLFFEEDILLKEAHEISENIIIKIEKRIPESNVLTHFDTSLE